MGACLILTPLIIAGWPAISAAVTGAVTSMGFALLQGGVERPVKEESKRVEMEVGESEILESGHLTGERIVAEREGVRATFSRDGRGGLKVCMEGKGKTEAELRAMGNDLIGRVTQQYVYHRIVSELKGRHMAVVDEQVSADRTVKIRVRSV